MAELKDLRSGHELRFCRGKSHVLDNLRHRELDSVEGNADAVENESMYVKLPILDYLDQRLSIVSFLLLHLHTASRGVMQ